MSFLIRLSISIIFLFGGFDAFAQESKIAEGEKALAEAAKFEKTWWIAGSYQKITLEYEKALTIWREIGDKKREAETLLFAARNFQRHDETASEAKNYATQAAEIFKILGDAESEAFALGIVAWYEYRVSKESGKSLFEKALALAKKAKSADAVAEISGNYALIISGEDEFEKSLELLENALPMASGKSLARIHFVFGIIFWRIGDAEKSLFHYELSHKIYKENGDFSWATTMLENSALVYVSLENPEKALENYREALPFRRQNGHQTAIADNLTNIADALVQLNQAQKALENLREAVEIYERTANRFGQAWSARVFGDAYLSLRNYEKAFEYFEKARLLQSELNNPNGVARGFYNLARVEFARGNLPKAREFVEQAIAVVENQLSGLSKQDLRLAFFSARRDYYELYIEILEKLHREKPQENYDWQAFEASEKSRARNLYEMLSGKSDLTAIKAREIQNLLDADTVFLEYSIGKRESFLFAVTREKLEIYRLPKAAEIAPFVQDVRLALSEAGRRNYGRFVNSSRRLYEVLLKPSESILKTKKHLLIAPDDSLNYLPFDVLLTEEPARIGRADFQKLPYLINNRTISYTPSANVLAEISKTKQRSAIQTPQFVAFGDPIYGETNFISSALVKRFVNDVFNSPSLPRLPDSNREVTKIAINFGDSARIFLRDEATEQNIKQNRELSTAQIIHFATHGIINEKMPQFSGLLLSQNGDSDEDGLLQTEEIYALNLNADLVVLSACRTALGKNLRGEGVIGLTRAFLRAGSKSVAATLWQVEDVSTADLMIDFYKNLKTAPEKSAALREAKLTMIKNPRFSHPHFWASFSLIGAK